MHWQDRFTDAMHAPSSYDAAADEPIPSLRMHNSVTEAQNEDTIHKDQKLWEDPN